MKNIAVIKGINAGIGNSFLSISFQNGSASYREISGQSDGGTLYKCELKFKISGLGRLPDRDVVRLKYAHRIQFSDVNGLSVILGSFDIPINVECEKSINGKIGGYRGYDVTVTWDSPTSPQSQSFI